MAYGQYTEYLMTRMEEAKNTHILHVPLLRIHSLPPLLTLTSLRVLECFYNDFTSLPELPASLERLYCYNSGLTSLPELPASLEELDCSNTQIATLPPLPTTLKSLNCYHCLQLHSLPPLPPSLQNLRCYNTSIVELPDLPASLEWLIFDNIPLSCENMDIYIKHVRQQQEEQKSRERTIIRTREVKEALMMNIYHPDRVQTFIDKYGMDTFDEVY